jgi:hypothetical protein
MLPPFPGLLFWRIGFSVAVCVEDDGAGQAQAFTDSNGLDEMILALTLNNASSQRSELVHVFDQAKAA